MIRLIAVILMFAMVMMAASCARIRVNRTSEGQPPIAGTLEQKHHTVIFGIESLSDDINLAARCPNGWERITTWQKPFQAFLSAITLNLYSPWTVKLECSAPKPPPAEED